MDCSHRSSHPWLNTRPDVGGSIRHCQGILWLGLTPIPTSWAVSMLSYWVNIGNNQHLPYKAIFIVLIAYNSILNRIWIFLFTVFIFLNICSFWEQFSSKNSLHPQILLYLFQALNSLMQMCFHLTAAYVGSPGSFRAVTVISYIYKACKPKFIQARIKKPLWGVKCPMEYFVCKNFGSF